MRNKLALCAAMLLVLSLPVSGSPKRKRQMVPTPQRVAEIQAALKAHGYKPGTTWADTQEICRYIADEHGWQTDHAPDLRVLALVGLAGPYFDPSILNAPPNRLDIAQRAEAERTGRASYPLCKEANCTKP